MYINPSDAFLYLSNQLSWIGIGVNPVNGGIDETTKKSSTDDGVIEATDKPKAEALPDIDQTDHNKSTVTRATNFVSDSMKAVGVTVSRLSRSFSTEKTGDDQLLFGEISTMTADSPSIIPLSQMESSSQTELSPVEKTNIDVNRAKLNRNILSQHRRSHSVTYGIDKISATSANVSINNSNICNGNDDIFSTEVWT